MTVDIQAASLLRGLPSEAMVSGWADAVSRLLGTGDSDVCIRIVDEDEGRSLNARFRQIDKPTNVLSFPADLDIPELKVLGDIVICAPVVHREAEAQQKSLEHHFAHLVIHGMLHLHGYDHDNEEDATEMESLEVELLAGFGIAHPYQ